MRNLLLSVVACVLLSSLTGCELYHKLIGFNGTPDPTAPIAAVVPIVPVVSTDTGGSNPSPISYKVFILAGQSNMRGNHQGEIPPPYPNMLIGVGGPGYGFGVSYLAAHPGTSVKMINCAIGGTSIIGQREGQLIFDGCLSAVADQMGPTDTIEGVLFWQGETDAIAGMVGSEWARMFGNYRADIRRRVGKPNLPIMFVQLGILAPNYPGVDYNILTWDEIKLEQEMINDPCAAMAKSEDLQLSDHIHYTTESHAIIGNRLFRAFERL